jgi:hypothetical protein
VPLRAPSLAAPRRGRRVWPCPSAGAESRRIPLRAPSLATGGRARWGVTATSGTNAWAAGWSYIRNSGHIKALIEHWNGFTWKLQTAAIPG